MPYPHWEAFFYELKASKQLVKVTDCWGVVREGRLYRCGSDRINVVPLKGNNSIHSEVYYSNIRAAEMLGPEPAELPEFPVDWNRKPRSYS